MNNDDVRALAESFRKWMFGPAEPNKPLMPKRTFSEHPERNYRLKNKDTHRYLQYEHQTWGINLGWTDDANRETALKVTRFFLATNGPQSDPVRYGELVALGYGDKGSFIRYDHRDIGINLNWSDTPVFEWKIFGGKIGEPVKTGELVALFNTKSDGDGEFLIYFDRSLGGDIGWPTSKTYGERIAGMAGDAAKRLALDYLKSKA